MNNLYSIATTCPLVKPLWGYLRTFRGCLPSILALGLVTSFVLTADPIVAGEKELTLSELKKERHKMATRKRRIIFNNDGDDLDGHGGPNNERTEETAQGTATPAGLLKLRTSALFGSQVDAIFYHSIYGMKLIYQDSAFKTIYEFPDRKPERRKIGVKNCQALMANYGMDTLEVMIDYARKNGLEIFYSNRVNDVHDYYFPKFLSALKVRHPEYTIGHAESKDPRTPTETLRLMRKGRQSYTGLNFGLEVVRDLTVEAMREVCRTYDIDGIDLDFFRSPRLFASSQIKYGTNKMVNVMEQLEKGFAGSPPPAGPQDIEHLNDMMRKIRVMTQEEGLRRGKPILVAARGIIDPEYSLAYGMDFRTWLEEDLIDIVMPIHHGIPRGKHLGSLQAFIQLAHQYGVPAYPCLRFHSAYQQTRLDCRGEAMSRFAEGADGITTFNKFDPQHNMWHELGDPNKLQTLDKTYTCPHSLPVTVTNNGCDPLQLLVGDDVLSTPTTKKHKEVTLRINVTGITSAHRLQVKFNGFRLENANPLPHLSTQPQEVCFKFSIAAELLQVPKNTVTAWVEQPGKMVTIDDLHLDVLFVD